jgi:hypothetical protein
MTKLQPNFSWQKYEGKPEDQKEQFQHQLQNQHIKVSNAVNATIDDISYFLRERPTGESWIDNTQIFTKTLTGLIAVNGGDTLVPTGIVGMNTLISLSGSCQLSSPTAGAANPLPYVDPLTLLNSIGLYLLTNGTVLGIRSGNGSFVGFTFYVTIKYTKVRS